MKLNRDLGVTQETAWLMVHKIHEAFMGAEGFFEGVVEVDETYVGGLEGNKQKSKRFPGVMELVRV